MPNSAGDSPISVGMAAGATAGDNTELEIVGCLGDNNPWEIDVVVEAQSVQPSLSSGAATIAPAQCRFTRGDANHDQRVCLSDAITILVHLFRAGSWPIRCLDAGDANDDGHVELSDAVALLGYLFSDGAPLPSPYPGCGTDPTVDELGCEVEVCE